MLRFDKNLYNKSLENLIADLPIDYDGTQLMTVLLIISQLLLHLVSRKSVRISTGIQLPYLFSYKTSFSPPD